MVKEKLNIIKRFFLIYLTHFFLNLKINDDNRLPDELGDLDKYNSLSGDIDIELEEILLPSLPKKN